ncbi:hypothetical protein OIU78_028331 [Salix suchowensis]|nr:hypothetical protein OIU78_028331 [Salix suchowensis]
MELEDAHSDLCSLRKLYGLLQGSPDGVQMAGFLDERAKVLLKSLLDAATEKALLAYSKIIVDAQLGVSNTPYSSQSVQPKAMPYLEPPVSPDVENASPKYHSEFKCSDKFMCKQCMEK